MNLYDDEGDDETCDYVDYTFTFNTNGTATAHSNSTTKNGFWSVEISSDNTLDLILNFEYDNEDDPFEDLNDDWDVLGFDATFINLRDISGGNGGTDLLNFGRTPYDDCNGGGGGGDDPDPQELRDIMETGTWYVDTYLDDGDDETADYSGYTYTFYSNQTVLATNGSENVQGIWIVTVVAAELNFEFDMDSPVNGTDDDEYKVTAFSNNSVTFITRDSSGNVEDTLIIKRN